MMNAADDVIGDTDVTDTIKSQNHNLAQESITDVNHHLLDSVCSNSNMSSSEEHHLLSNSVISAGAFSRIGNSLSSDSHSESCHADTPTAAVDEDEQLVLNETFQRLGNKLMEDCTHHTPLDNNAICFGEERIETESNLQLQCQTLRTQNISTTSNVSPEMDTKTIPIHLISSNDNKTENISADCAKSPEQQRLEKQVQQIEDEIAEARHCMEEEEQAQHQVETSIRDINSVDEDLLKENDAIQSLQNQLEAADANINDVLKTGLSVSGVDDSESIEIDRVTSPLNRTRDGETANHSNTTNTKSPRKEHQLPPKSPDNTSFLSRGISLFRSPNQTTPASRRVRGMDNDSSSVVSDISRGDRSPKANRFGDDALKKHLEESGLLLLKRLIEFLSECTPAPDEDSQIIPSRGRSPASKQRTKQRGLTLPASAIGWITHQMTRFDSDGASESFEDTDNEDFVPKHQLQCVQFLLRRVVSIRISGQPWPPQAATQKAPTQIDATQAGFTSRMLSKFASDQSTAVESVEEESCGTSIYDDRERVLSPFQLYYQELQSKPHINMEMFPNATKVVIDGIPPNWITNLALLKNLEMFQMEKGCLLDANQLFFSSDVLSHNGKEEHDDSTNAYEEQQAIMYSSLSKLRLSNCAIGEMSGLRGRSKKSIKQHRLKQMPPFSRFPNLVSLNLSHNELFRTKTAFAGLSSLPMLSSINLSYNRLSRLDDVYMYIGNVAELILTGNEITSTRGIDRLFSLERLSLNENNINSLSDIAGVANLPFLMNLDLRDNPLMVDDTNSCRIKVLNLFREMRCKKMPKNATYRDMQCLLPVLDNELATKDELVALKDFTFRLTVIPTESAAAVAASSQQQVENINDERENLVIDAAAEISVSTPSKAGGLRRIQRDATSQNSKFRVAGSLLLRDNATRRVERFHTHLQHRSSNEKYEEKIPIKFSLDGLLISIRPEIELEMSVVENDGGYLRRSRLLSKSYVSQCSRVEDADNKMEESDKKFPYSLPDSLLEEASEDVWIPSLQADRINASISPMVWNEAECNVNDESKCKSSDGDNSTPTRVTFGDIDDSGVMNETIDEGNDNNDGLMLVEGPTTGMFGNIWEDTIEKTPSMVAETAQQSDQLESGPNNGPLDFQAAEQSSEYDGPADYNLLSVSRDLDLYFDSFVFPAVSDSDENASEQCALAPRIQLYKFDRDAMTNNRQREKEMGGNAYERYLGVWREGVLACGSYARKRLAPIQLRKRGFHGDIITRGGKDVVVSESRRYILCLSDKAVYFIIDDEFSTRKNSSKRAFPSRISTTATFGDAEWPHAVMRHPIDSLKRIVIGFQFQRLTLQFMLSNGVSSSSFEYTYVVLTSNKAQTVSLLQTLQSNVHAQDAHPETGFLIENDDKLFLDGLGAHSSEVVLHYQILHQIWKTGNRRPARRSFVLTDTKIYLLDEIYCGDGTDIMGEKSRIIKLGDVSLTIIDEANLSKVTEVRAANEDPRKITLVVLPSNKLKRGHRWRLVCNDGESAERLIDDVRNTCQR